MNKQLINILGLFVILIIYATVLTALVPALPIMFLTALLAWMIIRRPFSHPGRADSDHEVFRTASGKAASKLVEVLI